MSESVNLALTAAGQALRAKIEAGQGTIPLNITRIVTASGTSDDPLNLTAVVNPEQEFTITNRRTVGPRTMITAVVTNIGLSVGYPLTQIGFYALDPDVGEILYRISQFGSPNWVPAANEKGWTYEPTFNFITGNASEVIVSIDPAGFTTKQDVWHSVEYSDADVPEAGTRTHYRIARNAPYYQPIQPTTPTDPTDPSDPSDPIPGASPATLLVNGVQEDGSLLPDGGSVVGMVLQTA